MRTYLKRTTMIAALLLACAGIHAQGLTLSLNITAGGLKDAMTSEQRKAVTNLTLTGGMNDADFYLIRDSILNLEVLDLKHVAVDTIPAKAFYQSEWDGKFNRIVLPRSLKYIGDSAFVRCYGEKAVHIVFTGKFPEIGKCIFNEEEFAFELGSYNLDVSDDNEFCMKYERGIYSSDGKTFYQSNFNEDMFIHEIKEGTEKIASRAFFGNSFFKLIIPESVKYIGDEAFANICIPPIPMGQYLHFCYIACKCTSLPELGKEVFSNDMPHRPAYKIYELYVKEEVLDLYKTTSPWNNFVVRGWDEIPRDPQSIKNGEASTLVVNHYSDRLEVKDDSRVITKAELIDLQGKVIQSEWASNNQVAFYMQGVEWPIVILRVIYSDGKIETVKLNTK